MPSAVSTSFAASPTASSCCPDRKRTRPYCSWSAGRFASKAQMDRSTKLPRGIGCRCRRLPMSRVKTKCRPRRSGHQSSAEWLGPESEKVSAATRRDATVFEREFQPTQPLNHYMPTVVTSPKPRISQLAVQTLALTESVDSLVMALVRSPHEESRVAAIDGLRTWLVFSPDNGAAVARVAQNRPLETTTSISSRI